MEAKKAKEGGSSSFLKNFSGKSEYVIQAVILGFIAVLGTASFSMSTSFSIARQILTIVPHPPIPFLRASPRQRFVFVCSVFCATRA